MATNNCAIYNFVLYDDYINEMENFFRKTTQKTAIILTSYLNVMDAVCCNNVISGETAAALQVFTERAKTLKAAMWQLGEMAEKKIRSFADEIDDIDKDLY